MIVREYVRYAILGSPLLFPVADSLVKLFRYEVRNSKTFVFFILVVCLYNAVILFLVCKRNVCRCNVLIWGLLLVCSALCLNKLTSIEVLNANKKGPSNPSRAKKLEKQMNKNDDLIYMYKNVIDSQNIAYKDYKSFVKNMKTMKDKIQDYMHIYTNTFSEFRSMSKHIETTLDAFNSSPRYFETELNDLKYELKKFFTFPETKLELEQRDITAYLSKLLDKQEIEKTVYVEFVDERIIRRISLLKYFFVFIAVFALIFFVLVILDIHNGNLLFYKIACICAMLTSFIFAVGLLYTQLLDNECITGTQGGCTNTNKVTTQLNQHTNTLQNKNTSKYGSELVEKSRATKEMGNKPCMDKLKVATGRLNNVEKIQMGIRDVVKEATEGTGTYCTIRNANKVVPQRLGANIIIKFDSRTLSKYKTSIPNNINTNSTCSSSHSTAECHNKLNDAHKSKGSNKTIGNDNFKALSACDNKTISDAKGDSMLKNNTNFDDRLKGTPHDTEKYKSSNYTYNFNMFESSLNTYLDNTGSNVKTIQKYIEDLMTEKVPYKILTFKNLFDKILFVKDDFKRITKEKVDEELYYEKVNKMYRILDNINISLKDKFKHQALDMYIKETSYNFFLLQNKQYVLNRVKELQSRKKRLQDKAESDKCMSHVHKTCATKRYIEDFCNILMICEIVLIIILLL